MKVLAWLGSWLFFWLGDIASSILGWLDEVEYWVAFWYPIYSALMSWSSALQDKYDIDGPWGPVEED